MLVNSPWETEHGAEKTRGSLEDVSMCPEHDFAVLGSQDNIAIWARETGMVRIIALLVAARNDGILAEVQVAGGLHGVR